MPFSCEHVVEPEAEAEADAEPEVEADADTMKDEAVEEEPVVEKKVNFISSFSLFLLCQTEDRVRSSDMTRKGYV